jgi:type I restriction enzyme S subunit
MTVRILPTGWATARLPDLVGAEGFVTDGDWVESKDQDPEGAVRLTQLADIGDGVWKNRSARFLTRAKVAELRCTVLVKGDVLIARMPDPLGRSCVFPGDVRDCITVVDVCIVRPGHDYLSTRWLSHFINSPQFRSAIYERQSGSTRGRISKTNLCTLELRVPPVAEQHRIVEAIDSYFTRLDDATTTLERVRRNLERYRASVLKAAVEGRLVPTEAELARAEARSYESASDLLERFRVERRLSERRTEPSVAELPEFPGLPEGWGWTSAQEACEAVVSGSTPVASKLSFGSGEIPFLKVYNLTMNGELDFRVNPTFVDYGTHSGQLQRSRVMPGDVLTNIVGPPLGKVSVVTNQYPEWNVNQAIVAFRPSEVITSGWLRLLLLSSPIQRWLLRTTKTTTSQVNLAVTTCRRLPIPLPPREEQARIVAEADRLLSMSAMIDSDVFGQLARVLRLRQSILKWAFESRLVRQDPSDEPASTLLERIRADRGRANNGETPGRNRRGSRRAEPVQLSMSDLEEPV